MYGILKLRSYKFFDKEVKMTKTKKNVIIIVSVVLVFAIALSLGLGLTLGRKKEVWEPAFAANEKVSFSVLPLGKEILTTSVTIDDLSPEYREKLLAFTFTKAEDWQSDDIFRKFGNQTLCCTFEDRDQMREFIQSRAWSEAQKQAAMEKFERQCEEITASEKDNGLLVLLNLDWGRQSAYENKSESYGVDGYYSKTVDFKSVDTMSEAKTAKYFGGRSQLNDGEILVHKWVYYSIYASMNELSIDAAKVEEILDSEDTIAKHAILRNYDFDVYGADGMAMEYYGIIPEGLDEVLEITLTGENGEKSQTYKIVGYYADDQMEEKLTSCSVSLGENTNGQSRSLTGSLEFRMNYIGWNTMESNIYFR